MAMREMQLAVALFAPRATTMRGWDQFSRWWWWLFLLFFLLFLVAVAFTAPFARDRDSHLFLLQKNCYIDNALGRCCFERFWLLLLLLLTTQLWGLPHVDGQATTHHRQKDFPASGEAWEPPASSLCLTARTTLLTYHPKDEALLYALHSLYATRATHQHAYTSPRRL